MVDVEQLVSWVLRAGVLTGAGLMVIGFFISINILWLGILILILTPFIRVIMAGIGFLHQNDTLFFAIATYVILVLVIGTLISV